MIRRFRPPSRASCSSSLLFQQHPSKRFCATGATDSSSSSGSNGNGGSFSVFRVLGLTAAFAIGSLTMVIVTWPILDTFIMPGLSRRALYNGTDQFREGFLAMMESSMTGGEDGDHDDGDGDTSSAAHFEKLVRLRQIIYGSSNRTVDAAAAATNSRKSNEEKGEGGRVTGGGGGGGGVVIEENSVVVLTGPCSSGKSELARTVALATSDEFLLQQENDQQQDQGKRKAKPRRPLIYINARGFVDAATILHGTLTYCLVPTLGVLGLLVHAYIKLCNAGLDMIAMNSGHQHHSFIFFAMTLGHVRQGLLTLNAERQHQLQRLRSGDDDVVVDDKPLVVIDSVESLIELQQTCGRNSEVGQMCQMLVQLFLRSACDEKTCNLLLVADSSTLLPDNSNSSSSSNTAQKENNNNTLDEIQRRNSKNATMLLNALPSLFSSPSSSPMLTQQVKQFTPSDSNYQHDTLATCTLMQSFPSLRKRSRFVFTDNNNSSSLRDTVRSGVFVNDKLAVKLMERVRYHDDVPPLMALSVASLLVSVSKAGASFDAADISSTTGLPQAEVWRCLVALEAEGLAHRVAGQSLATPAPFVGLPAEVASDVLTARIRPPLGVEEAPAFVASEVLSALGSERIAKNTGVTVDVLVPVRNRSSSSDKKKKWLSSLEAKPNVEQVFEVPSTALRRVSISREDVRSARKLLDKLSGSKSKPWSGLVNVGTGAVATSEEEIKAQAMTWRDNEVIAPALLEGKDELLQEFERISSSTPVSAESSKGGDGPMLLLCACVGFVSGAMLGRIHAR